VLKVVWIVPGFSSGEQDACIPALLELARALAKRCRLTVISMRYPYERATYQTAGAVVHSIGGGHRGPLHTPGIWRNTLRTAGRVSGDVLHAFWAYEPGVIAAGLASRMPVVISLAGGELVHLPEISYGLWGKWRTRRLIQWSLPRARAVTAGSRFLIRKAAALDLNCRIQHLPLGVNLQRWPYPLTPFHPLTVLNVGSLQPVKGHRVLLKAFQQISAAEPAAALKIAGSGLMRSELQEMAAALGLEGKVRFVAEVAYQDMIAVYAGASVFVQASLHEAQGMALLEAAACGVPVAGTEVGVLADLVPEAAFGATAGDAESLARAVLDNLRNRAEAADRAALARRIVAEEFSIEAAADRFLQLYSSLC